MKLSEIYQKRGEFGISSDALKVWDWLEENLPGCEMELAHPRKIREIKRLWGKKKSGALGYFHPPDQQQNETYFSQDFRAPDFSYISPEIAPQLKIEDEGERIVISTDKQVLSIPGIFHENGEIKYRGKAEKRRSMVDKIALMHLHKVNNYLWIIPGTVRKQVEALLEGVAEGRLSLRPTG